MEQLSGNYTDNVRRFDQTLGVGRSCDLVSRDYCLGGRRARLWVIDGYGKDGTLERMGAFWLSLTAADVEPLTKMQDFIDRFVTFSETNVNFDVDDIVTSVLLGKTLLLVEGLDGAALIDAKE
jgi:stage V sporulation protein AF